MLSDDVGFSQKAVFNALLEAKLSVEVELGDPSVIDVLSRTSEVVGVSQIELIEERFLLELRQEEDENISDYTRRVGVLRCLPWKHSVMSIGPPIVRQA